MSDYIRREDADMKKLSPKEAITILEGMRIDIPVPKAAVTQRKRNVALDMAISALSCSEIPNSCHPHSQTQKSMNIIMTTQIVSGIDQKHGIDAL